LALEAAGKLLIEMTDAVIIAMGDAAAAKAIGVARAMRESGLSVEILSPERKLKALLSRANKIGTRFAVIIGENEIAKGVVVLRDLQNSTQREVPESEVSSAISSAS
jgi:histidyl-tRNA synthetase